MTMPPTATWESRMRRSSVRSVGMRLKKYADAVIDIARVDVADGTRVRRQPLFHFRAVEDHLRRAPTPGKNDLRPIRFDLSRRSICQQFVKLLANESPFLVDGR